MDARWHHAADAVHHRTKVISPHFSLAPCCGRESASRSERAPIGAAPRHWAQATATTLFPRRAGSQAYARPPAPSRQSLGEPARGWWINLNLTQEPFRGRATGASVGFFIHYRLDSGAPSFQSFSPRAVAPTAHAAENAGAKKHRSSGSPRIRAQSPSSPRRPCGSARPGSR